MLGANYFGHAVFGTGDKNVIELPLIKFRYASAHPPDTLPSCRE